MIYVNCSEELPQNLEDMLCDGETELISFPEFHMLPMKQIETMRNTLDSYENEIRCKNQKVIVHTASVYILRTIEEYCLNNKMKTKIRFIDDNGKSVKIEEMYSKFYMAFEELM